MKSLLLITMLLCLSSVLAIRQRYPTVPPNEVLEDESSFSNINEVRTNHFDLAVIIDFDNTLIYGTQTLHFDVVADHVSNVFLDVRDLLISQVTDDQGRNLDFQVRAGVNDELGQRLEITLADEYSSGSALTLTINYVTSKNPSAVSWLTPEQTAGGQLPYMYTQCESIHCRSIAPLQDTPAIKATYTFYSQSREDLIVRASGNLTDEYVQDGVRHTKFIMEIPVVSYLLAFASGNLVERQLGSRTYVITEPELVEKSVSELSRLNEAVEAAETYLTPYEWGVYKVLMLPPSFPYGGMENPLLTFANSGLINGDRSSFRLFVHELSHSWFGNLVTNENWSNFWLNEGFTVFLERKTDSILFDRNTSKVSSQLGNSSMYMQIEGFGLDSNYTSLHPDLNGNHPDTSISGIPYEKGFQFLVYLESLVGEETFRSFLQSYVDTFSYKSLEVEDFISFFIDFVSAEVEYNQARSVLDQIDWQTWVYSPGYPPVTVDFGTDSYDNAIKIANDLVQNTFSQEDQDIYAEFNLDQRIIVVNEMVRSTDILIASDVERINSQIDLSSETNPRLIASWLMVAIPTGYEASPFPNAEAYVGSLGRYALISPIYQEMIKVDRDASWEIFRRHENFYHPITREIIRDLLVAEVDPNAPPIAAIF
ncbi:unnamed protein product [Moneuplotes crassus]|uniref:Peptidase M1 leukotriene A4 hydrolase/aminopeptidase C-terminal domain-containing protein n=1 Tax=Euplotes crassus TaxID=5936 RepID=A0AAD1X8F7_EUPCR|nr:unnamed protein product [Moneuplotes crassus]